LFDFFEFALVFLQATLIGNATRRLKPARLKFSIIVRMPMRPGEKPDQQAHNPNQCSKRANQQHYGGIR